MAKTWQQLQRELEELEASMTDEQLDAVETSRIREENRRESARQDRLWRQARRQYDSP